MRNSGGGASSASSCRCRENAAFVVDYCGWTRIDCAKDGAVRSIEDIHAEVMEKLSDLLVP